MGRVAGLVGALLLCACAPPEAPEAAVDAEQWADRVTSPQWATRKLAQRELALGAGTDVLAQALVQRAAEAVDTRAAGRLLGAAHLADPVATVQGVGRLAADPAVPLQTRVVLASHVAWQDDAVDIAPELIALSGELRAHPEDPGHLELGVRLLAMFAPERALPVIVESLDAPDKPHRKAGAAALTDAPIPGALDTVLALTTDPEVYVRRRAVTALGLYPDDPAAVVGLVGVLEHEADDRVCTRAIEAVEHLDPELGTLLLLDRLGAEEGCGPRHQYVILASIRRLLRAEPDQPEVRALLRGAVHDAPDLGLAGYAAAALGDVKLATELGPVAAYDGLGELVSRTNEPLPVRLDAITALGGLEDTGAARRLESLLGDIEAEAEQQRRVLEVLRTTGKADPAHGFVAIPYTSEREDPALRAEALAWLTRVATDPHSAARLAELEGSAPTSPGTRR